MSDLRKAAELALEALEELRFANAPFLDEAMEALRTALAQPEQECIYPECETGIGCDGPCGEKPADTVKQEPVTLLPDGSAFGVMSFPLPESHWLYAERQYRDGEYEPIELGKPILTRELKSAVVSAVRYAIRAATNCGKEMDFDPDALVLNAVYALCGPYTAPVDTIKQEPALWLVQYKDRHEFVWGAKPVFRGGTVLGLKPLYTAPPSIEAAVLAECEDGGSWLVLEGGLRRRWRCKECTYNTKKRGEK